MTMRRFPFGSTMLMRSTSISSNFVLCLIRVNAESERPPTASVRTRAYNLRTRSSRRTESVIARYSRMVGERSGTALHDVEETPARRVPVHAARRVGVVERPLKALAERQAPSRCPRRIPRHVIENIGRHFHEDERGTVIARGQGAIAGLRKRSHDGQILVGRQREGRSRSGGCREADDEPIGGKSEVKAARRRA